MIEPTETNIPSPDASAERTLTIEKLVYGGDALARDGGQVVLAPYALPGERVRLHVTAKKSQMLRARVEEVLEPSAHRVAAPCRYFGLCGGCHYQHAEYEYQLAQKQVILREVFQRVGKIEVPERLEVVASPPFGYRNRAQFHVSDEGVGFHEAVSHKLLPVAECLLCSPKLGEGLEALRRMRKDGRFPRFVRTVELFTNETEVQLNVLSADQPVARRFFEWATGEIPGLGMGALTYRAAGFDFRVSGNSFFQVNRFLVDRLVQVVLGEAQGERAVDLYSGVGLFTLALAKRFRSVTAVESGVAAWKDMEANAKAAGVSLEGVQTSAENYLSGDRVDVDFVVADPPRAGLGKQTVKRLLEWRPRVLTIVSCDCSTLARDVAALQSAYEFESLTMLDLFPQTYHMEAVARLRLRGTIDSDNSRTT